MAKAEYKSAVRSRKLIRSALAELLHEKPLDKITVTDVVKRADINRGTFYAHYLDIPDVIDKQVESTCALMRESLRSDKCGKRPDPSFFLGRLQEMIEEEQEFYQKVLTSNIALPIIERLRNIFLDCMQEYEKEFGFASHEEYLSRIMFSSGGAIMLYHDWFSGKLPCTLSEVTRKAVETICKIMEIESRPSGFVV